MKLILISFFVIICGATVFANEEVKNIQIDIGRKRGELEFYDLRSSDPKYNSVLKADQDLTISARGSLFDYWKNKTRDTKFEFDIFGSTGLVLDSGNFYDEAGSNINYDIFSIFVSGGFLKQWGAFSFNGNLQFDLGYATGRAQICPYRKNCNTEDQWKFKINGLNIGSAVRLDLSHESIFNNNLKIGYLSSSSRMSNFGKSTYTINPLIEVFYIGYAFNFSI